MPSGKLQISYMALFFLFFFLNSGLLFASCEWWRTWTPVVYCRVSPAVCSPSALSLVSQWLPSGVSFLVTEFFEDHTSGCSKPMWLTLFCRTQKILKSVYATFPHNESSIDQGTKKKALWILSSLRSSSMFTRQMRNNGIWCYWHQTWWEVSSYQFAML